MDLGGGSASSDRTQRMLHCKGRLLPVLIHNTYFESFISICCRISCLSSSVLLGKIFLSSSSCLLGLFRSFTASSSFLHFLGKVPGICNERKVIRKAAPGDETGTSGEQGWHGVTVIRVGLCKEQSYTLMSESSTTAEQGSDTKPPQMQRERVPQGMQELQLNLCFILGARCVIG